ncbi:pyridoxal-phosphate dependent enzyme [Streptomyces flavidovirens]|uniref:Pyridoxal-phosphate dependent enzyme n=1 Tax=Streptomyces flavidovirens TaxID=67298 RepID=A0ABW6R9H6_9ACTN
MSASASADAAPSPSPSPSLATGQRSLGDPEVRYPLWPVLTAGCPATSTPSMSYPVEVDYAYDDVPGTLFHPTRDKGGIDRWAPLLPPLHAPGLGEGRTPLVELTDGVWVKDESRNPTWSHKDRLNRCTVSAAVGSGAQGIVVASSGNHGASAAAYAARAGLRCVVLASAGAPPAVQSFVDAYGAVVLPVPEHERWSLMRQIVDRLGYHPVSNLTAAAHTGHAFGPEGYKTVAYEIYTELGVPAAVFVPTGYGELLFGVWKGFAELVRLGLADRTPRMYACEPAAGAPLAAALDRGVPAATVPVGPTSAYAIDCPVGGYRGVVAVRESGGRALRVSDAEMVAARAELAAGGLWAEVSSAASLAGLRQLAPPSGEGALVCVSTSSGFKDMGVGTNPLEPVSSSDWATVAGRLRAVGISLA